MRNQQNVKVRVNSNFETICPFPVGYVYMSSNSTSPADIYGGTWSAISGGRYMRAAGAWGNGGSNTITINQMPSHNHIIPKHYVYDKTGWSAPINGLSLPQVAQPAPSTTPFATIEGLDAVTNTGGGQHSTPLTKTFGRGTELPKEGDASCVTFNKFKSVLRAASRKFVRFPSDIFICLQNRLAQLVHTGEHGLHLLIQNFSDRQALGIRQVEVTVLLSPYLIYEQLQKKWGAVRGRILAWLQIMKSAYQHRDESFLVLALLASKVKLQRLVHFLYIVPVMLGIAQPSYIGGVC